MGKGSCTDGSFPAPASCSFWFRQNRCPLQKAEVQKLCLSWPNARHCRFLRCKQPPPFRDISIVQRAYPCRQCRVERKEPDRTDPPGKGVAVQAHEPSVGLSKASAAL